MFALGCIQSLSCHTDRCPTGVATQDPKRWRKLDTADKSTRVFQFHENTVKALRDLLCAAGLEHPRQLGPEHILRRVSQTEVRSRSEEHTSELQSLMRISYAVFCLKNKKRHTTTCVS